MRKKTKDNQIVVRVTHDLDNKIMKAADKLGLSKAAWLRQLAIQTLKENENGCSL
jgi:hypothetical protein